MRRYVLLCAFFRLTLVERLFFRVLLMYFFSTNSRWFLDGSAWAFPCSFPLFKRLTFSLQFYRTASYYISNILYNLPVAWFEAGLLAVTSYFLVGMSGGAAEFFLFLVLFLCVALAGSAIGRCLAYALPTGTLMDPYIP